MSSPYVWSCGEAEVNHLNTKTIKQYAKDFQICPRPGGGVSTDVI